ncbi:hypothetical protein MRBLMN1_005879 [Chitinophaga ginsengisegetis]|uniref:hypothetical protein n=1 Tax=Chitinophaga ginsengisegetis TaxID=393003 RepID=UPI00344AC3DC
MIYLIDDKKLRQEKYFWTTEKLSQYKQALVAIYSKGEFDKIKATLFASDDIILFHDSFFDDPVNQQELNPILIRQTLVERSQKAAVVFFGGGTSSRTIVKKYASIPVSTLYNNLSTFLDTYIASGQDNNIEIRTLVFGKNYELEEITILKEEIWNLLYDESSMTQMTFSPEINGKLDDIFIRLHKKGERINYFPITSPITVAVFKTRLSKIIKEHING